LAVAALLEPQTVLVVCRVVLPFSALLHQQAVVAVVLEAAGQELRLLRAGRAVVVHQLLFSLVLRVTLRQLAQHKDSLVVVHLVRLGHIHPVVVAVLQQ
jgi:hypothetical protein